MIPVYEIIHPFKDFAAGTLFVVVDGDIEADTCVVVQRLFGDDPNVYEVISTDLVERQPHGDMAGDLTGRLPRAVNA